MNKSEIQQIENTIPERFKSVPENIKNVPRIVIDLYDSDPKDFHFDSIYPFHYEVDEHYDLPHVIKFSGGRSSGLLLFLLLENGILKVERGDVIVFNDTSAEHPETYKFAIKCKRIAEEQYGIPFFWIQFQTYEDARGGEWVRLPTYRMIKPVPWTEEEPDGYHWRGEAFEELLSWSGYVPNQFQRTCTQNLKLEVTRQFLRDWFACKDGISRLGHYGKDSRLADEAMYMRHKKHRGKVPREIYLNKKSYVRSRPVFRPEQKFSEFSHVTRPIVNSTLKDKNFGGNACFGNGGVEYVTFVGLRYDEMSRVVKVKRRNSGGLEARGYEGEHVYTLLATFGIKKEDVDLFWAQQNWGLNLPNEYGLSNCVYCFMKGAKSLRKVNSQMQNQKKEDTNLENTPCDLHWWKQMEERYGRDLKAEKRILQNKRREKAVIGFFGIDSGFTYKLLEQSGNNEVEISRYYNSALPCDCTD